MLTALNEFLNEGDVKEKTLVKYPSISLAIALVYILLVKWIGPSIMKNRKPFDLKYAMITYDLCQCIVNAYLTFRTYAFILETWHLHCMVKENPRLPFYTKRILRLGWYMYLVKFVDLLDTCMYVLRKKNEQVSFLHVFHHAIVFVIVGCAVKNLESWAMGFYLGFAVAVNTTVHVVVYFYYGLTALGPHMTKYLWWKKYLTAFQMVQFTLILIYMIYGFITGCEEMGIMEIAFFVYIIIIYAMFIDFYSKYKNE